MKQMYLYFINLAYVCCLAGMHGCTAGPVEDIVPEGIQPVELVFGKPDLGMPVTLTRADVSITPDSLPAEATVRIGAYFTGNVGDKVSYAEFSTVQPSFEATYVIGEDGALSPCLTDAAGNRIPGNAQGLIVRGGVYDFYAVSPARGLVKDTDGFNRITDIPHQEDIMTSYARGVTVSKTSHLVTLETFTRRCAQLVFTVAPSPNNKVPMDELRATSLVLTELSRSGASLVAGVNESILKTGGEATDAGTIRFTEDDFEPVAEEADTARLGLNKVVDEVLPKNTTAFRVALTVVRNGVSVDLSALINKSISFDEGKRYVFTLQVENDVSRLQMRVMNWNTFAFADNNVGGAVDGSHPADPDINQGVGVSFTVAEWRNIEWNGNGNVGEATE